MQEAKVLASLVEEFKDLECQPLIHILVLAMLIDYVIGLTNAIVFKKSKKTEDGRLSSNAGTKGIVKKVSVFLLTILLCASQDLTDLGPWFFGVAGTGFIGMEILSIFENIEAMGVPLGKLKKTAEAIFKKEKDEEKEENKNDESQEE